MIMKMKELALFSMLQYPFHIHTYKKKSFLILKKKKKDRNNLRKVELWFMRIPRETESYIHVIRIFYRILQEGKLNNVIVS